MKNVLSISFFFQLECIIRYDHQKSVFIYQDLSNSSLLFNRIFKVTKKRHSVFIDDRRNYHEICVIISEKKGTYQ